MQVCWKEAGLGDNQLIEYSASANATATFHCVNNGGQCPNAANKEDVSGPVSAMGAFQSEKNGQITQCLTISASLLQPDPFCPGGQTETLTDISYTNIQITDLTNNVSKAATPISVSATPFVCP